LRERSKLAPRRNCFAPHASHRAAPTWQAHANVVISDERLSALDYSKFDEFSPAKLSWKHQPELAADPAQQEAADILQHPISVNAINLSLAARVAMRRLLGIPVFFS
jgi:hypothetical protein